MQSIFYLKSQEHQIWAQNYPKRCRFLLTFSILQYLIGCILYPTMQESILCLRTTTFFSTGTHVQWYYTLSLPITKDWYLLFSALLWTAPKILNNHAFCTNYIHFKFLQLLTERKSFIKFSGQQFVEGTVANNSNTI